MSYAISTNLAGCDTIIASSILISTSNRVTKQYWVLVLKHVPMLIQRTRSLPSEFAMALPSANRRRNVVPKVSCEQWLPRCY